MRTAIRTAIRSLPGGEPLLKFVRRRRGARLGHRGYVGGLWDEIGRVQFEYLVERGLQPQDILLDIGCGALRGGQHFIAYLEPEHYLGIDHNEWLIEAGLEREVPAAVQQAKRPRFVVSRHFEFEKFGARPTVALAHSVFSHLTKRDVRTCLSKLRPVIAEGGRFFATFVPVEAMLRGYANPDDSDDLRTFAYEAPELIEIGRETGWHGRYVGQWGHPRGQEMLEFEAGA